MNALVNLLLGGASGLVVAFLATLVLPGTQHVSKPAMLLIGTGAGAVGGWLAGVLGWNNDDGGVPWGSLVLSIALAALAVVLWTNFRNKKRQQLLTPKPGVARSTSGPEVAPARADGRPVAGSPAGVASSHGSVAASPVLAGRGQRPLPVTSPRAAMVRRPGMGSRRPPRRSLVPARALPDRRQGCRPRQRHVQRWSVGTCANTWSAWLPHPDHVMRRQRVHRAGEHKATDLLG